MTVSSTSSLEAEADFTTLVDIHGALEEFVKGRGELGETEDCFGVPQHSQEMFDKTSMKERTNEERIHHEAEPVRIYSGSTELVTSSFWMFFVAFYLFFVDIIIFVTFLSNCIFCMFTTAHVLSFCSYVYVSSFICPVTCFSSVTNQPSLRASLHVHKLLELPTRDTISSISFELFL